MPKTRERGSSSLYTLTVTSVQQQINSRPGITLVYFNGKLIPLKQGAEEFHVLRDLGGVDEVHDNNLARRLDSHRVTCYLIHSS